MFTILAEGNWSRTQVKSEWTESTLASNSQVQARIDQAWQTAGSRAGIKLFDGPMCRLESHHATADRLDLRLSRTSYKIFLGTNLTGADHFDPAQRANPVGLSPALITSDGQLILGRRNARVAYYPGRVHPFAGALEPKDGADIFAGMLRELDEELGLKENQIASIHCIGIAEDNSIRQPELIFRVEARLTQSELAATMDADEHRGMWSIPATVQAANEIASQPEDLTPIALAAITLWSRSM